ncbi:MAG: RNA methyltransferase [Clostridia bacterium]|nr:RNA methyltransferase [Clostridia bacterium]
MIISSSSNDKIKEIKKLNDKKYRIELKQYIIEGVKILEEAILSNQKIVSIVICDDMLKSISIDTGVIDSYISKNEDIVIYVTDNVFESISDTKNPQGILSILEINKEEKQLTDSIIFLDNIQDPGNVGTIIRSALAFNFKTVVLNKGCADIYNSKVLRATMGNIFSINIILLEDNGYDWLMDKKKDYTIYASTLINAKSIYDTKYAIKRILIIGNEANGISDEVLACSNESIVIPMNESVESLNVSNAASIIMAEMSK